MDIASKNSVCDEARPTVSGHKEAAGQKSMTSCISDSQIADFKLTESRISGSVGNTDKSVPKLSYKEKFRSKVKTVLTNVKDAEVEAAGFTPAKVEWINMSDFMSIASDFDTDNDPVTSQNIIHFARKSFVVIALQLAVVCAWTCLVCTSNTMFRKMYVDSELIILVAVFLVLVIYTTIGISKRIFASFKSHVFMGAIHTLCLAYLIGGLSFFIDPSNLFMTCCQSLSMISGIVCYCKLTSDRSYSTRKAGLWAVIVTAMSTACMIWTHPYGNLTSVLVATLFGFSFGLHCLMKPANLAKHNPLAVYRMKHYIVYSMNMYLDFVRSCLLIIKLLMRIRRSKTTSMSGKDLDEDQANQQTTISNMFKFTQANDETKVL